MCLCCYLARDVFVRYLVNNGRYDLRKIRSFHKIRIVCPGVAPLPYSATPRDHMHSVSQAAGSVGTKDAPQKHSETQRYQHSDYVFRLLPALASISFY